MMGELVFFSIVGFAGTLLTQTVKLDAVGRLAAAVLGGLAMFVVVGVILVIVGAPTSLGVVGGVTVAMPILQLVIRPPSWGSARRLAARWAAIVVTSSAAVFVARSLEPGRSTLDSYDYVSISALMANGHAHLVEFELLRSRLLGYPALHIAAFVDGRLATSALPMVTTLATLVLIASLIVASLDRAIGVTRAWVTGVLAVAMLLTSYHFLFEAFYINAHMVVGAFTLVSLSPLMLASRSAAGPSGLEYAAAVCLSALPLLRPEGGLLAMLVIVAGTGRWRDLPVLRVGAIAAAVITIMWNLHLLRVGIGSDATRGQLLQAVMTVVLAVVVVAGSEFVYRWPPFVRPLRIGVMVSLWFAPVALSLIDWHIVRGSVAAFVHNTFLGEGTWGPMLPVLLVAFAVLAIVNRGGGLQPAVFVVAAFFPLMLALAPIRSAAYRVGPGDSLNRSMLHVIPTVVVWVVVSLVDRRRSLEVSAQTRLAGRMQEEELQAT